MVCLYIRCIYEEVTKFALQEQVRENQYLEHSGDTDDAHKKVIPENSSENVYFIWLPCIELVEDLTNLKNQFVSDFPKLLILRRQCLLPGR